MAGFREWFRRSSFKWSPSTCSDPDSKTANRTKKVIHGRITKNAPESPSKTDSPSKRARFQLIGTNGKDAGSIPLAMAAQAEPLPLTLPSAPAQKPGDGQVKPPAKLPTALELLKRLNDLAEEEKIQAQKAQQAQQAGPNPPSPSSSSSDSGSDEESESEFEPEQGWRREQVYLNQILNARNEYTLMPSTWRMHFRGIPLPEGLFYNKTKSESSRPRIYARAERFEYRGAMALRKLMDVQGRVTDIRNEQLSIARDLNMRASRKRRRNRALIADIVKQLKRRLVHAITWAQIDGDLAKYGNQLPPNIKVIELNDVDSSKRPDSDQLIQRQMCNLADQWRKRVEVIPEGERPVPPVVFGFVIFKHIIFIVTLDAADPDAICHIPCQLNMSEVTQYQWNALALMVTICWARDVLMAATSKMPDLASAEAGDSSDPDA
ncbi:hypothetical protein F4775DRAFT_556465 [Biscogniauxia sp. FL1348]|nr:hypothetical protein F4775DRAFT_556465 [Biscogniauxia sp. FL1348]